jgi:ParB-like chromosome segregation protein Spo0J
MKKPTKQWITKSVRNAAPEPQVRQFDVESIIPTRDYSADDIKPMMASIRTDGVRIPLDVLEQGILVSVVDGDLRLAAAKALGLKKVPVRIYKKSDLREIRGATFPKIKKQ